MAASASPSSQTSSGARANEGLRESLGRRTARTVTGQARQVKLAPEDKTHLDALVDVMGGSPDALVSRAICYAHRTGAVDTHPAPDLSASIKVVLDTDAIEAVLVSTLETPLPTLARLGLRLLAQALVKRP